MGRRLHICLLALAAASACSSAHGRAPPGDLAMVTEVTDGDTFHATYLGRDERIRLIGVDTPEVSWYGGQSGCYGEEAGLYVRGRLAGASVRLEFDKEKRDRYERLLAYVYLGDELVNLTLLRLGYATAEPVPPDTRMAPDFEAAQKEAKEAGLGLWSACSG